MDLQQHPGSIE